MIRRLIFALAATASTALAQFHPYYVVKVDIQSPDQQFVIDRTFVGNNTYIAVDVYNGSWTNPVTDLSGWNFNLFYARSQSATQGVTVSASSVASNRISFLGATNTYFEPFDDYYVEVSGTSTGGMVKTFGTGSMIVRYSPLSGSPTTLAGNTPINWNLLGPYSGTWPFHAGTGVTLTQTSTGLIINASIQAGSGNLTNAFVFAGVTNPTPCGFVWATGTADVHSVTGCVSYVTTTRGITNLTDTLAAVMSRGATAFGDLNMNGGAITGVTFISSDAGSKGLDLGLWQANYTGLFVNLNADRLDSREGAYYLNRENHTGNVPANALTGSIPVAVITSSDIATNGAWNVQVNGASNRADQAYTAATNAQHGVATNGAAIAERILRTGETNAVDLTNTTVMVRDPVAAAEPVTLRYLQSGAGGAVVTNAIDDVRVNGTNYTGLTELQITDSRYETTINGSTLTLSRAWSYAPNVITNIVGTWSISETNGPEQFYQIAGTVTAISFSVTSGRAYYGTIRYHSGTNAITYRSVTGSTNIIWATGSSPTQSTTATNIMSVRATSERTHATYVGTDQ